LRPTCFLRFPSEQRAQRELFIYYFIMQKPLYNKPFLRYQDQISLLKSRGLTFTDEEKALHLLENINYYRLSGYWYPLLSDKQNHIFKSDANFEAGFSLYKFDRELRKLIISELEKIEIAVRTRMTYVLSTAYDPFWIEDNTLFANSRVYRATVEKIKNEFARSDEEFIIAFKSKYSNPLPPSFILLEITSFGALSRLYDNLKPGKSRKEIANMFGLSDRVFASWLHALVYIRNVCAHHSRLWNKLLQIQPLFPRRTKYMWLVNQNVRNSHMYYILSMMIYILNTVNPNHTFKQKLENLFKKYPNVDRRAMGFPENWQTEPLWK